MARNGSGTFIRTNGVNSGSNAWTSDRDGGTNITVARHDAHDQDLADAITQSISKDGQTPIAANLPMSGYRHTGVGAAVSLTDYARLDQVQNSTVIYAGATGGTTTAYAATLSPAPSAYADGQRFIALANATNTGTTTLAIGALAALTIKKVNTSGSLINIVAGDIRANQVIDVVYNSGSGGQWILLNPSLPDGIATAGLNSNITGLSGLPISTWTPTLTASGSMTVSAQVINLGQWIRVTPFVEFKISATFTLGGTASNEIRIPHPAAGLSDNVNAVFSAYATDGGGTFTNAAWNYDGTNIRVFKPALANWTLGANASVHIIGKYRFY